MVGPLFWLPMKRGSRRGVEAKPNKKAEGVPVIVYWTLEVPQAKLVIDEFEAIGRQCQGNSLQVIC